MRRIGSSGGCGLRFRRGGGRGMVRFARGARRTMGVYRGHRRGGSRWAGWDRLRGRSGSCTAGRGGGLLRAARFFRRGGGGARRGRVRTAEVGGQKSEVGGQKSEVGD